VTWLRRGTAMLTLSILVACTHTAPASHGVQPPQNPIFGFYAARMSNVEVEEDGIVRRLLGTRRTRGGSHEGFIVDVPLQGSGQTLTIKIEDNVDLTGPIPLKLGDHVHFRGEYVYDPRGGIVHWTHRDPRMRHAPGFIEVNGRFFQ